jgi:hypothetical protein
MTRMEQRETIEELTLELGTVVLAGPFHTLFPSLINRFCRPVHPPEDWDKTLVVDLVRGLNRQTLNLLRVY